jgi:hypothetical protein
VQKQDDSPRFTGAWVVRGGFSHDLVPGEGRGPRTGEDLTPTEFTVRFRLCTWSRLALITKCSIEGEEPVHVLLCRG